ncbi:S8 family serine peptidase [candidate division KSB1 bacterium]|nr:S8 family serine peptidase [candidate division KSB1 bacterium]
MKYIGDTRYTKRITVNFNNPVFMLNKGESIAEYSRIRATYPVLHNYFGSLEQRFGKIKLIKQIPSATWGDVERSHLITGEKVRIHEWSQLYFIYFSDYVPIDLVLAEIKSLPEVEYTHGPVFAVADVEPNDPDYINNIQWNLDIVNAEHAWDISKGSSNIFVGIVEGYSNGTSGIPQQNHPDFWTGSGTSGNSKFASGGHSGYAVLHATEVAGVVGAATNDGDGIASLGWNIRMRPYHFSNNSSVADAINLAVQDGNHIINCSFMLLGTDIIDLTWECGDCRIYEILNENDSAAQDINDAFEDADTQGVIVVASAGNTGWNRIVGNPAGCGECANFILPHNQLPAKYDNTIALAATTENDESYPPYNDGYFINVAAPGINIRTTGTSSSYQTESGTSFSAPLVSALVGLLKSVNINLTRSQIENILESTAIDINSSTKPGFDTEIGHGRVNAYEALKYTLENYGGAIGGIGETVKFHEDITISSGVTLTIAAGTTVNFDQGAKLTINGTLDAQGTASNPITFDRNGSSGTWDGIYLAGGAASSSELVHCEIKNAQVGIEISNAAPLIEKCYVHSCSSYPMKLTSAATPKVLNNKFYAGSTHAVYISSAGGDFGANEFRTSSGTTYGVYITGSTANPNFDNKWGDGGNLFDLSNISSSGAYAAGGYPEFGSNGAREGENDFINRNGKYYIKNYTGSTIDAEYNYWGGTPQATWFYGSIDYSPYESSSNGAGPSWKIMTNPFQPGLTKYDEGNYSEALVTLKLALEQNVESDEAAGAVFKMAMSALKIGLLAEQETFLVDLSQSVNPEVQYMSRVWLAYLYFLQKRMESAEKIALRAPIGSLAERSELLALVSYYSTFGDTESASRIAAILNTHHADDDLVFDLSEANHTKLEFQPILAKTTVNITTSDRLSNYPNPFNPSTTIQFNLPQETHVKLQIFDMLGRHVQTLVNREMGAGIHSAEWDGRNSRGKEVAAGSYLARLNAGESSQSIRLSLIR